MATGYTLIILMIGLSQSVYGKYVYPGYNIPNNYHYQKKYNYPEPGPDITGKYCETRQPQSCCPGRDDKCTVQILDSLCYCDMFCNRTTNPYPNSASDCCPDFWSTCAYPDSTPPPPEPIIGEWLISTNWPLTNEYDSFFRVRIHNTVAWVSRFRWVASVAIASCFSLDPARCSLCMTLLPVPYVHGASCIESRVHGARCQFEPEAILEK